MQNSITIKAENSVINEIKELIKERFKTAKISTFSGLSEADEADLKQTYEAD